MHRLLPFLHDLYSRLLAHPRSASVFALASELRAAHRIKTPDALHLAAALAGGCTEFWTNDDRLANAAASHVRVVALDERI